ncbi:hypothetical protein LJ737_26835, partial [Hymenobacter sp. 15J16-1T3B]|uniref:hypothetical protein n=1 Tax=Hymenobacter sp. 15J16-1T3B TaxID=2886941 RepID=UPI001D105B0D
AQIRDFLQRCTSHRQLRDKSLGEALTRLGIKRQQRRVGSTRVGGYYVQELLQPGWAGEERPQPAF